MAKKQLNTRIPEELYNKVLEKELSSGMNKPQIVTEALTLYIDNDLISIDNTEPLQSHIESHSNTITTDNTETYQEQIRFIEDNHKNILNEKEERIKILQETYNDLKDQLETKDRQIHNMLLLDLQSKPLLESGNKSRIDGLKCFLFGK